MSPDNYDAVDLKADILGRLGMYEECIAERDKYVARNPEYVMSYLKRAYDLMNAHRFEDAIEDFNTATVLIPEAAEMPFLLIQRGNAYKFTGKQQLAEADYKKTLEIEKDSVLKYGAGTPSAYAGLGDKEMAISAMQSIIENDSVHYKQNLYNLACLYAKLGMADDAIKTLAKSIENGYNEIGLILTDYDLDPIRDNPAFIEIVDDLKSRTRKKTPETLESDDSTYEVVEVPFSKEGGVTKVMCTINSLPLYFIFDTGASDVTLSMVEANFMLKNDYIKPEDVVGSAHYIDANGDISEGTVINLRNVNFGGLEIDNVRASVVRNQKAPLLLGQSVLGRLGKIEINNNDKKLVITHKVRKK